MSAASTTIRAALTVKRIKVTVPLFALPAMAIAEGQACDVELCVSLEAGGELVVKIAGKSARKALKAWEALPVDGRVAVLQGSVSSLRQLASGGRVVLEDAGLVVQAKVAKPAAPVAADVGAAGIQAIREQVAERQVATPCDPHVAVAPPVFSANPAALPGLQRPGRRIYVPT